MAVLLSRVCDVYSIVCELQYCHRDMYSECELNDYHYYCFSRKRHLERADSWQRKTVQAAHRHGYDQRKHALRRVQWLPSGCGKSTLHVARDWNLQRNSRWSTELLMVIVLVSYEATKHDKMNTVNEWSVTAMRSVLYIVSIQYRILVDLRKNKWKKTAKIGSMTKYIVWMFEKRRICLGKYLLYCNRCRGDFLDR